MKQNKSSQKATSAWQKASLVLFGLILCFVLLEAGLRLGGFVLLSIQEHRNLQSIKQKGAYRILCIGESTTQRQYPQLLEQVLNRRNIGVRFSVIDKGRIGANTYYILRKIESYLTEYRPDMVIAMMGINDWGQHMIFEPRTTSQGMLFIRSFKVYKLTRFLGLHLLTKVKEMGLYKPDEDRQSFGKVLTCLPGTELKETIPEPISTEGSLKRAIALNPKNDKAYVNLGWVFCEKGEFLQAEISFKKAIALNPKNDEAYVNLGWVFCEKGEFLQAESSFKKAIALNSKNGSTLVQFGRFYRFQGKFSQAEDFFWKAIELNPNSDKAYVGLGELYRDQFEFSNAESSFKKAIEINPENDESYHLLGLLYRFQNKFSQAEDLFKKAMELNPKNHYAFYQLGRLYREQGKFLQAVDLFKKAIKIHPENERELRTIASLYEETGKPDLAKEFAEKANRLRSEYYVPGTVSNYRRLKEILDQRGVKLVCVQYPMRNVESLKRIFKKDEGVIFVDNERVFKEALKKANYKEYFRDLFGGDFGHCTQKGNELLAQNIADMILREVFNK